MQPLSPSKLLIQIDTKNHKICPSGNGYKLHLSKFSDSAFYKIRRRSSPFLTNGESEMASISNIRHFRPPELVTTINTGQGTCAQKKRFHYLPLNIAEQSIPFQCEISQEVFHPPVFLENIVMHVPFYTLSSQLSRAGLSG